MRIYVHKQDGRITACTDADGNDYSAFLSLIPENMSASQRMANLASHLINHMRPFAIDHEVHLPDHDGEHFYGAALIETSEGRFFLSANLQLDRDHTDRNCAETSALVQSFECRKPEEKAVRLWFTGAVGNFTTDPVQPIKPGHEGRRPTPCGKCLQAMHDHNPDMEINLLPILPSDTTEFLTPYQGNPNAMERREILTLPLRDLYRYEPIILRDPDQKKAVQRAYDFITREGSHEKVNVAAELLKLKEIEESHANGEAVKQPLVYMNDIMMRIFRQHYRESHGAMRHADVTIIRTASGRYYLGANTIGDTTSTPPSAGQAIYNATIGEPFGPVTDVCYASIDMGLMKAISDCENDMDQAPDYIIWPPVGSSLERMKKYGGVRPFGSLVDMNMGPRIWMFTPNSIEHFDTRDNVTETRVSHIMPRPFGNPKADRTRAFHLT